MRPERARTDATRPSPDDVDAACAALEELKRQLQSIARVGGGEPSLGLLVATADNSPDAVILCTDSAEIRIVNSAAARLTGYATRELQTLTVWDITHSASQGDFDVLWKEFLRAGRQRGTYLLRTRQGDAIHVAYCAEVRTFGDLHLALLHPPDGQTQP